jgi:pimeloyl-ACP methyl ester carboxylesterase
MPENLRYLTASRIAQFTSRFVLFPSRRPIDPEAGELRSLQIGDAQISICIARSDACEGIDPSAFVLCCSGNASRAERATPAVREFWAEHPVEVWGLNYPGFGESTGPATLAGAAEAGLIAFDELAQQAAGRPIILECHSFGCTVGLHIAARRNIAAIVLYNPPPLREVIFGHYGWWNLWLGAAALLPHIPKNLDSLKNAAKATAPALVVSSEFDEVVPPRFHRRVFNAYAGEKRWLLLEGAGHGSLFHEHRTEYRTALRWVWAQVARRRLGNPG